MINKKNINNTFLFIIILVSCQLMGGVHKLNEIN